MQGMSEAEAQQMVLTAYNKHMADRKRDSSRAHAAAFQLALMYRDGAGVEMSYVQVLKMLANSVSAIVFFSLQFHR